ncbi:MAG TPA: hypothetical protein VFD23_02245 [Clostridia bacterium]|nr:hypothetical protein [Clostridia bacterium]
MVKNNGFYSSGSFKQRSRSFFTEKNGLPSNLVSCVLFDKSDCLWAGTAKGLAWFNGKKFVPVAFPGKSTSSAVTMLFCDDTGRLWVGNGSKLFTYSAGKMSLHKDFGDNNDVMDMAQHGDQFYMLTNGMLYCYDGKAWQPHKETEGDMRKLAISDDMFYVSTHNMLNGLEGKRPQWKGMHPHLTNMPDSTLNAIKFDSWGHLWVGTDEGVYIYDNSNYWIGPNEIDNLPAEKIYAIETDKQGSKYFASDNGVIILDKGALKYLGAERWVPATDVNAVAVTADGNTLWAATKEGLSRITTEMTTLKAKADHYLKITEKHHIRDNFVCGRMGIVNEDLTTGSVHISDNDGLWTGYFVASEAYRFAVTGDKKALENARKSMNALLLLTRVTEIPGFTARAIRRPGEVGFGNGNKEWHLTSDKSCEWKCETSSDEMVGHFLAFSLYYDMCANDAEKKEIKLAVCGMVDHMIENNYYLIDKDGLPTTWACWAPEKLNHDDKWIWEKGVNSLEILSFLKAAHHMSGSDVYDKEYKRLIKDHHYALNVAQHKMEDGHACHIDDNLGFLSSIIILRLEKDETLRALILMGMEHHWQYERIERTPLWNFIYGAFTGRNCDIDAAVQTLRETPLSLIGYKITNSTRKKLVYDTEQEFWGEEPQLLAPLPADERRVGRDDSNFFRADSGNGTSSEDGTFYLLPYWFARYNNLIKETGDK